MRTTSLLTFALLSAGLSTLGATPARAQYGANARIWVENDREYFRYGDRLRVRFSTSANSYVAVVHVDPDGFLEFLYPSSPWDAELVRGGRVYTLDRSGWSDGLLVRGSGGIGYLYLVASPVPLDYSYFRGPRGASWDWSYAGRRVTGDPFWAMEQLTRVLIPGWGRVPYAVDFYTYYVGGIHRYPRYACSSFGSWGWGYSPHWDSYFGACNRLDLFLRDNPFYFDSRRYRGDRWRYYRDYRDWDPRHSFKEDHERSSDRARDRYLDRGERSGGTQTDGDPIRPAARPVERPAPERPPEASAPARSAPSRDERPAPAARPRPNPGAESSRPAPRARPEPRSSASSGTRPAAPASRGAARTRASDRSDGDSPSSTPRSRRGD